MANKKSIKREIIEWGLMLGIPLVLYLGGWHTEVLGRLQQGVLYLGLMKPDTQAAEIPLGSADYNMELTSLKQNTLHLESLKGKVVFMNFWATWCPPCVAEMPNIHSLYQKMGKEVVFVMINLDDDSEKANRFIQKKGYTFPVYRLKSPLPQVYYSQSIPATFILSPEGTIAAKKQGMADYDNKEFRNFLKELTTNDKTISRR